MRRATSAAARTETVDVLLELLAEVIHESSRPGSFNPRGRPKVPQLVEIRL